MDYSPPVSPSMKILQARILEWVAMPSSGGSFQPRGQTQVSCIAGGFFIIWATREVHGAFKTRGHGNSWPLWFSIPRSDFFFSQLAKICPENWPCHSNKLCLPLTLTPNSNFHTLFRLDISCRADLASDSRPLHPPCPSQPHFTLPSLTLAPLPHTWPQLPSLASPASVLTAGNDCFQLNC